jgi:hypothetical protein
MHPINTNIGAYVSTANPSHAPAANAAGTRNGTGYAINDTRSIILTANLGATSGTPTSFTVIYKLQQSIDNSTYTDAVDVADGTTTCTLTISTASSAAEKDIKLAQFLGPTALYFRFLETVAFVSGTSPTVLSGATITRGPGHVLPQ